jgi:hypothetical protein
MSWREKVSKTDRLRRANFLARPSAAQPSENRRRYDAGRHLQAAVAVAAWRMISQIDASQFEGEVNASAVPVLVEFFTDHCSPCEQMIPILAEIAAERPETLRVLKFDAGENPQFASKFRIPAQRLRPEARASCMGRFCHRPARQVNEKTAGNLAAAGG